MGKTEPLKRSPQLAPLSRDHHGGLMFVWNLRQGLKKKVQAERLKNYILWQWNNHLVPHFEREEKILLKYIPASDKEAGRMKEEHIAIRHLMQQIERAPAEADISALAGLLNDHIRFEERKLFTQIEKRLSPAQLDEILRELEEQTEACSTDWQDKFWEEA
jgi:hemerythrin-like domain-containing protein